jgi:hypothetical protein
MFENPYNQTLQDQIGQLSRLLGSQTASTVSVPQSTANRFDLVEGLEGAKAFLQSMLPSTRHIVWDSQKDTFYVLQKDANGQAQRVQICAYSVELEPTMEDKYVSKADFEALVSKLDAFLSKGVTDNG